MDFIEQLTQFSKRVERIKDTIYTEEATKTSIILPFFQILGYDVFNPFEFVPEYTADVGTKKGEKVDYAILINNEPLILIEAKSVNIELSVKYMGQLLRYFTVTKAKFGILTNGIIYRFYSDLEEHNKMDTIPFLEFNLLNIKKEAAEELKKFRKDAFNMKNILHSASDLKYMTMVKNAISEQFQQPSDQLIKALIGKNIYNGPKTQAVLDRFSIIIKKSFEEYINDLITERISTVITPEASFAALESTTKENTVLSLTNEERAILDYIQQMLNTDLKIVYRKTSRYAYMQIGDSPNKWICRVFIRKSLHLFTLHKFENANYECEYYFDNVEQLDSIEEIIQDVFTRCRNM